jgi:hypothetical protein
MRFATATAAISTDTPLTPANGEAEPSSAPRPAVDRCDRDRLIADHCPLVRTVAGGVGASASGWGVINVNYFSGRVASPANVTG